MNPQPSRIEIKLFSDLQELLELRHQDSTYDATETFNKSLAELSFDSVKFIHTIANSILPIFEDPKYGVTNLDDLNHIVKCIKKILPLKYLDSLNEILWSTYSYIDRENNNGNDLIQNIGVLCSIQEILKQTNYKSKLATQISYFACANNYRKLQNMWLSEKRSLNIAFQIKLEAKQEMNEYKNDKNFKNAIQNYSIFLKYCDSTKLPSDLKLNDTIDTYRYLLELYNQYSFCSDSSLFYLKQLEFLNKRNGIEISDAEKLSNITSEIFLLNNMESTDEILSLTDSFLNLISIVKPKEKLLANNGVINEENINEGSSIFKNADIYGSPIESNKYLIVYNIILQNYYKANVDLNKYIELFEYLKYIEAPFGMQLIRKSNELEIYSMLDNIDAITNYEYQRISNKNLAEVISRKNKTGNFIRFYYSDLQNLLYIFMKNDKNWRIDTVQYPELFNFNLSQSNIVNKRYELIQENKIYKAIDDFFQNTTSNILVVPHGFIYNFPVEGISNGNLYLGERYKFYYSKNIHSVIPKYSLKGKNLLLVGSPTQFNPNFEYLANGATELNIIDSILTKRLITEKLINSDATDINFSKHIKNKNIIHIATHSYFSAQRPFASGIVLAKTSNSDGIITAYELQELMKEDSIYLVTLSSCQSANGTIVSSSNLGLTNTLLEMNISNVICSIGNVNDKVAVYFMEAFYKNFILNGDLVESMHKARLEVKKVYDSRAFWCNYVLYSK